MPKGLASWLGLQEHKGPVTSLAAQQLTDLSTLLISSAGDGNVCVWGCAAGGSSVTLQHKLCYGTQLQLCVDVVELPDPRGWCAAGCHVNRLTGQELAHDSVIAHSPISLNACTGKCTGCYWPAAASTGL